MDKVVGILMVVIAGVIGVLSFRSTNRIKAKLEAEHPGKTDEIMAYGSRITNVLMTVCLATAVLGYACFGEISRWETGHFVVLGFVLVVATVLVYGFTAKDILTAMLTTPEEKEDIQDTEREG